MKSELGTPPLRDRVTPLRWPVAYGAWALAEICVTLVFVFQGYYPALIGPVSNVLPAACVGVAFYSSLQSVRRYGFSIAKKFQAAWLMFALGTGIWIIAETTWALYYFVLNVPVPYPSIADVFYMGGYLPMLLGLAFYLDVFAPGMTRRRLIAALSVISLAAVAIVAFVIPPELSMSEPLIQRITDIGYPILDLSLLAITVLSLAIFFRASLSRWLLFFGAAAILYAVADELFLYQVAAGTYYNGSFDDLLYLLGYLLFALAFYEHRRKF